MVDEQLKIFDRNYREIGTKSRHIIHQKGYWHEVFHCWVIEKVNAEWSIYLQLRSKNKKDYPGQYDITAAGHLLATETAKDGVRELKEELGIDVLHADLYALGVIPYSIDNEQIRDYEFAHVFVYELKEGIAEFSIQCEELDGIYRTKLAHFIQLVRNETEYIEGTGYEYENGRQIHYTKRIRREQMAALPQDYLDTFILKLNEMMTEAF